MRTGRLLFKMYVLTDTLRERIIKYYDCLSGFDIATSGKVELERQQPLKPQKKRSNSRTS